jgi:hypothetical protein
MIRINLAPKPRPHHWIGMAGLRGCIPAACASYATYDDAVDGLAETHDLGRKRRAALRRDGYLELSRHRYGNEYAEITECDCKTPEEHDDG